MIEACESRQMLSGDCGVAAGLGVVAGTAFIDLNHDGRLGTTDAYLPGATIQLYKADGSNCPIQVTKTDARGGYKFDNVAPGDYLLKEIPASGYSSSSTEVNSQLNPGESLSSNTMKVTVVDPSKVFVNYKGVDPNRYASSDVKVTGFEQANAFGPMQLTLGTSKGTADLNSGYLSFCVNDLQELTFTGPSQYQVKPRPVVDLTGNPESAGRIAYLFNHYGNDSLTNVSGPALQLAIWELLYDGNCQQGPDFYQGDFQLNGPITTIGGADADGVVDQANQFYNESKGKSEAAVFLKTATNDKYGQQSMLATGTFNFGNVPNSCPPPKGTTGQVDYWNSRDGQSLIRGFNGGCDSTRLANWLSACYPNLYGRGPDGKGSNSHDLTGKCNSDVADLVRKFGCDRNFKAEGTLLASALSEYASTSSLGKCSGAGYGFRVTDGGFGKCQVNTGGSNGDAFDSDDDRVRDVSSLLKAADAKSKCGIPYKGDRGLASRATSFLEGVLKQGSLCTKR